ncbi:MAG TPA: hypothetical protein VH814_22570 [Steroidobacteraceae bacterium]|jgi:hypothetical protein
MQKIALVLAIAAVGEGLIALHLVRQLHEERENVQTLQARVTELQQKSQQAPLGAMSAAARTPAATPFASAANPPAPAVISAFRAPPAPRTNIEPAPDGQVFLEQLKASMERQHTLLRDPEYREAMVQQQKIMLMRMNPDTARDLDLTPDQHDRLYTTLAEQLVRSMDSPETPWDAGEQGSAKWQEAQRKAAEQTQANLAEVRKVLGDAKYREFEEYQAMAGVRIEANGIRQTLARAGVPLDDELAKPLAKVLYEQQQKLAQASSPAAVAAGEVVARAGFITEPGSDSIEMQEMQLESMEKYQRQQRDAMARVLSPQQLKVIQEEHEADLQIQRTQLRMLRAQQASGIEPTEFSEQAVSVAPARSD